MQRGQVVPWSAIAAIIICFRNAAHTAVPAVVLKLTRALGAATYIGAVFWLRRGQAASLHWKTVLNLAAGGSAPAWVQFGPGGS